MDAKHSVLAFHQRSNEIERTAIQTNSFSLCFVQFSLKLIRIVQIYFCIVAIGAKQTIIITVSIESVINVNKNGMKRKLNFDIFFVYFYFF